VGVDAPDPSDQHADRQADRQAYLEEQIQRQKRGEPIDVEWVKAELERIRRQQTATIASTQRNLRWLVIGAAILLVVLWIRGGGPAQGRILVPGLVLVGLLIVWVLRRRQS
jgi:Flp pilus assembly protein TadB